MNWGEIGGLAAAVVTLIVFILGGFIGALKYVLDRHDKNRDKLDDKITAVKDELSSFKEMLPMKYVMREDWIRFSSTIDAKLDAIRAELMDSLTKFGEKLK